MVEQRTEESAAAPSILEELLRKSQKFIQRSIADRLRGSVERAYERALGRLVICLIGAAFLVMAAVFLLLAGMEGLKQAGAPTWVAYLSLGLLGALAGALLLRRPRDRSDRRE